MNTCMNKYMYEGSLFVVTQCALSSEKEHGSESKHLHLKKLFKMLHDKFLSVSVCWRKWEESDDGGGGA